MKWSWRIGRVAGIAIAVHATFPLLLAWVALAALGAGGTPAAVLAAVGLVLAVFATVVLHELGHALTARHFGIRTTEITLLPIGGIAHMERLPREPRHELLITLAGPAVNVAIAGLLYAGLALAGMSPRLPVLATGGAVSPSMLLAQLLWLNLWLAAFNLLPAFPLDGGRVLRALLAMRHHDYARATATAARVGRAFALLFGLAGLFVLRSPFLVVIALFVWLAAATEAAAVQTAAALERVPLTQLMVTDVRTLGPDEPLARAAELTVAGFQQDFPVVEGGVLVGMLTQRDLVRGLAESGGTGLVRAAMRREFGSATPEEQAEDALRRLATSGERTLPVVRGGTLLGVLTTENVMEFVTLRAALGAAAVR
jgi:Zn-dependent protease